MVMAGEICCFSHFISVVTVATVLLSLVENGCGISRGDFPSEFVFGSGTSAYQVEGAAAEDGRTLTIWDIAAHSGRGLGNGDIACDQYHKYKEDVQLMVDTGLEAYRFSISWSRLIPTGRGSVNPKGVQYYNNLINELIKNGIKPHITLFHYDVPQELEDEYGGWLSKKIVKDFTSYADICFKEFGDRVSHWTTINEANIFSLGGYDNGTVPPNHCSEPFGDNCRVGNSSVEPYMVGHNCLLAHASVASLYKRKYQAVQNGFIGFNVFTYWLIPLTNSTEDILATKRVNDFFVGWLINPLVFGDYPEIMKKNVGSRLPSFTVRQSRQIKSSFDFIGLNHYDTMYVKDDSDGLDSDYRDAQGDMAAILMSESIGVSNNHLASAMQGVLEYFKNHYNNPPIYIHENGKKLGSRYLNDRSRVEYMTGYVGSLLDALRNGSNTKGYFTWSFMDLYELLGGYEFSYGLYYVDFKDPDLKRYARLSAKWYSNFLKGGRVSIDGITEAGKNAYSLSHVSYATR